MVEELKELFLKANKEFLKNDYDLISSNVNERTLCGALAREMTEAIKETDFENYCVDVEYNRNMGKIKTIVDEEYEVITINCDIIVHSRGKNIEQDNLIAIEMKKHTGKAIDKQNDKNRLKALTKDSFNNEIWTHDGITLPEHVCRYVLGIYYEINCIKKIVRLEYYKNGELVGEDIIDFKTK